MTPHEHIGRVVRQEAVIHAEPRRVYEAWASAEQIAQWYVDEAEGDMEVGATQTWIFEAMQMRLPLEVYEAVPGQRLAFGCDSPPRPKALMTIDLEAVPEGTLLRLSNSGFQDGPEWDDEFEGCVSGWILSLAHLEHWLTEHGGVRASDADGVREHLFAMLPGQFEYEQLAPHYTTKAGLEAWLATVAELETDPLEPGTALRMQLREGPTLEGQVLAKTRREVLLSWPELRGTLTLKSFSIGPMGRAIALDFNSWGAPGSRDVAKLVMDQSLPRLSARLAAGA